MNLDTTSITIAIAAAILSGMGTAIIAGIHENKKEKNRQKEREQDLLKLEIKDLKIELYRLERDLIEWKDKYYEAIQELISVKSELENALTELSYIEISPSLDTEF
jgi:septal ring factor EnvC (AmiA/AmiB activator)